MKKLEFKASDFINPDDKNLCANADKAAQIANAKVEEYFKDDENKEGRCSQLINDLSCEMPFSELNIESYNHAELYLIHIKLVKKWNEYQIRANQVIGNAINAGGLGDKAEDILRDFIECADTAKETLTMDDFITHFKERAKRYLASRDVSNG